MPICPELQYLYAQAYMQQQAQVAEASYSAYGMQPNQYYQNTCMGLRLLLVLVDMGGPMPLPIMGLTPLLELEATHRYVYTRMQLVLYMELATD